MMLPSASSIAFQLDVVVVTLVEELPVAFGFAVFDDDVVVRAVEADEHLVAARDEHTFVIGGVVVDVVPCVVTVVQVQVAAVVVALGAVARGVVTDHADVATGVVDVVLAVFLDVVVEPRLLDAHDIVFVAAQVEGHAAGIDVFGGGLHLHSAFRRYQVGLLYLVIDGLDGVYRDVGNDEIGQMSRVRVMEVQTVDFDVGDVVYGHRCGFLCIEEDDFRDVVGHIHNEVLNVDVRPAFFREFGTGVDGIVQLSR